MNKSGLLDTVFANLGVTLRYFASGFVALGLWILLDEKVTVQGLSRYPVWVWFVLAGLTGVIIYSVHTGAIVRAIDWLLLRIRKKLKPSSIPKEWRNKKAWKIIFKLDSQRILRRASGDVRLGKIQSQVDRWAELLNLLYCSLYFTILIPIIIGFFRSSALNPYCPKILIVVAVVFSCAFISSWRLTNREFWLVQNFPQ